jgi:hypothetical protein
MCLLRYYGYALTHGSALPDPVTHWIAKKVLRPSALETRALKLAPLGSCSSASF